MFTIFRFELKTLNKILLSNQPNKTSIIMSMAINIRKDSIAISAIFRFFLSIINDIFVNVSKNKIIDIIDINI